MIDPDKAFADFVTGASDEAPDRPDVSPVAWLEVDYVGNRGKRYRGRFKYTVPTIGDELRISAFAGSMVPMRTVDPAGAALARMIAYLTVTCSFDDNNPRPAWFSEPTKAHDVGPFQELYGRCLEYEAKFHGTGEVERGLPRDREIAAEDPGRDDRGDKARVGSKVPPPAQRRETLAGDAT